MTLTQHQCKQCELHYTDAEVIGGGCPRCFARSLNLVSASGIGSSKASPDRFTIEQLQPLFENYELLDVIGEGGMSVVVRSRQLSTNRLVAIKVLKKDSSGDGQWPVRFEREIRTLAGLSHPCVVTVFDAGTVDDHPFIVMEYVQGISLRELIGQSRLSSQEILKLIPDICDGLQAIHKQGIVHRDIKPENIMIDGDGRAKLVDFGLSKLLAEGGANDQSRLTRTQQIFGTPRYMAPEQFESTASVDHRADLYSLGAVLYEMLTGEVPQAGSDPPSKVNRKTDHSSYRRGRTMGATSIDESLDPIVAKLMASTPGERYQSAAEFRSDFMRTFSTKAPLAGPTRITWPQPERITPWIIAAIAIALFLAGCPFFDSAMEQWQKSIREVNYGQPEYAVQSRIRGSYEGMIGLLLWFASGVVTQVGLAKVTRWSSASLPEKILAPIHFLLVLLVAMIICLLPLLLTLLWAPVPQWVSVQNWGSVGAEYPETNIRRYWWWAFFTGCWMAAIWNTGLVILCRRPWVAKPLGKRLHINTNLSSWFCVGITIGLGVLSIFSYLVTMNLS